MGHKVHPTGYRLGVIKDWQSKWYSDAHYAEYIQEDNKIREHIKAKYAEAAISMVEIDRQGKDVTITLHTARPGIVIGRGGQRVDEMRQQLEALIGKKVRLNIQEIRQPELDAYLVARSVAEQIERRVAYRRAMKQSIFRSLQSGAKGIKISAAGRLAGAEIARRQTMHEGQVPLHTLRADIDYGFTEAVTTMGRIGVKVWIYKGQILPELKIPQTEEKAETAEAEAAVEVAAAETAKVAPVAEVKPVVRAPKAAPIADNRQARAPKAAPAPTNSIVGEKLAEATAKAKAAAEEKAAKPKTVKKVVKPAEEKEPEVKAAKPKVAVKKAEPAAEEAEAPKKKIVKKAEAAPETAPKAAKKATTKSKEEGKDATA